jgi:hypothetical protein
MGAMMLFFACLRVFVFPMDESPKFLVSECSSLPRVSSPTIPPGIGRDQDAVDVIHRIAKKNKTTSTLTVQDLHDAAAPYIDPLANESPVTRFSTWGLIRNSL